MKIAKIMVAAAIAAIAVLSSCKKEENLGAAKISVNPTELSFSSAAASQDIELTATRDWFVEAKTLPDWIALSENEGKASSKVKTITVTVLANPDNDRTGDVTFSIGLATAVLKVSQTGEGGAVVEKAEPSGSGTKDDPYNVSAAIDAVKDLTYTDTKNYDKIPNIFVKGVISAIKSIDTGTYGNAEYSLVDKNATAVFGVYRGYSLSGVKFTSDTEIKVGDEVVVFGSICNMFGTTPQFTQGNFIYSLNGNTAAQPDFSATPTKTVADFIATASTDTYYKLKGAVSAFNQEYCSFTLTDASGNISVYTVNNRADWFDKIKNGGTAEVAGVYSLYTSSTGAKTHEVVSAYILSFEEAASSPAQGDGSLENPFNVEGAVKYIQDGGDKETTQDMYVKGKISSIKYQFDAANGTAQFNISNDGTATSSQFLCYSVYYLENQPWMDGCTQIAVGDDVIIYGKFTNYNGTYETASRKAYVYSLNGKTKETNPVFSVKPLSISVDAAATEASFDVVGNSPWTASSDNADFTLSATSGEGAASVTVSFPANADTENAKTAKITVTTTAAVTTKTYEVVITQAKAPKANSVVLSLDFTTELPGWPAASSSANITAANGSGMDADFTLGSDKYTFFLGPNTGVNNNGGTLNYFWLPNGAYIGLPEIAGKRLVQVALHNSAGCSTKVKVGVYSDDAGTTEVAGGAGIVLTTKDSDYTYNLTGTTAGTRYYLRAGAANAQLVKLVLTYEE